MRLDAFLANAGCGSRSEVRKHIRWGKAIVNGKTIRDVAFKINPNEDKVTYKKEKVEYREFRYYMLNKPEGYITATKDRADKVVMELLDIKNKKDYFPVGRLDKETEGLLIITNDGKGAHELLSPKKHVNKIYYAEVDGVIIDDDVERVKEGITLKDEYRCLPAELTVLERTNDTCKIKIKVFEGKYHQVRRMIAALGKKVTYLKRIQMGGLKLDPTLLKGEFKELSANEIKKLKSTAG